jgi:hypothetical protein
LLKRPFVDGCPNRTLTQPQRRSGKSRTADLAAGCSESPVSALSPSFESAPPNKAQAALEVPIPRDVSVTALFNTDADGDFLKVKVDILAMEDGGNVVCGFRHDPFLLGHCAYFMITAFLSKADLSDVGFPCAPVIMQQIKPKLDPTQPF